jgi:uncharacterized protein (DUF488 family)
MNGTMDSTPTLWTIGHSNHDLRRLVDLLRTEQIEFVVDVRSYPYSKFAPHFNREDLETAIAAVGLRYMFLGDVLGGRPERDEQYDEEGHALYGEMAQEPAFERAIDRLLLGASKHRIALMCSCGRPMECHRRLLVGKVLCDRGALLRHILPDGRVETESTVDLAPDDTQPALFSDDATPWRSARSVSHRRRLSASSPA